MSARIASYASTSSGPTETSRPSPCRLPTTNQIAVASAGPWLVNTCGSLEPNEIESPVSQW